jgi:hypothetical protein
MLLNTLSQEPGGNNIHRTVVQHLTALYGLSVAPGEDGLLVGALRLRGLVARMGASLTPAQGSKDDNV